MSIKFPPQKEVTIDANSDGHIEFTSYDPADESIHTVVLTIGQFRTLIKNADELIADADILRKALVNK